MNDREDGGGSATATGKMNDEERAKLAAKLDRDLEEWMSTLEGKRYQDGWPEDRWEEEMAKHPFFMKQSPAEGETVSPLVEGLQRLKYDPDENTPKELASSYKDDGNFNFKHKNYRLAIIGYTEGIKIKCGDAGLDASLYNNRSASHFFLENYRSSLIDAVKALSFEPDHPKAASRAAQCAFRLKDFDACVGFCDRILSKNNADESAKRLKSEALKSKIVHERDERKKLYSERKKRTQEESLTTAVSERGIHVEQGEGALKFTDIDPAFPGSPNDRVHFDEDGKSLIWPVIFLYPEYKISDLVVDFHETSRFCELLPMLSGYPEWDIEKTYSIDNVNVYYEGKKKYKLFPVNLKKSLLEVMKEPYFELRSWTPAFIILVKNSSTEKSFLKSYGM